MEKQAKFPQTIAGVALATGLLLLVPLIAMQFSNEVNWGPADFIVAGVLLFSAGLSYVIATRYASNLIYKVAVASAIGSTLFLIWSNLAVGLIGSGPNAGNLMYLGVMAVIITGSILSRFSPGGMALTMLATSLALVLVIVIALLTRMNEYPGSSVTEVFGVNAFFACLYAVSSLLFRYVGQQSKNQPR